ncbi:MAG: hypothetical protein HOE90_11810 [Bacteriovoracaceae bacterium]|mgnify:CR=1 FL=1|jgi:hypothetical protein|nr:hypothetical protein [Bacteriovoracaceae bacterium]
MEVSSELTIVRSFWVLYFVGIVGFITKKTISQKLMAAFLILLANSALLLSNVDKAQSGKEAFVFSIISVVSLLTLLLFYLISNKILFKYKTLDLDTLE